MPPKKKALLTDPRKIVAALCVEEEPELRAQLHRLCRDDAQVVPVVFETLMSQFQKNHAQVRLGALRLLQDLFPRAAAVRRLTLENLRAIMSLCTATNGEDLPPPKRFADQLKPMALACLFGWREKYPALTPLNLAWEQLCVSCKAETDKVVADAKRAHIERRKRAKAVEAALPALQETTRELAAALALALQAPDPVASTTPDPLAPGTEQAGDDEVAQMLRAVDAADAEALVAAEEKKAAAEPAVSFTLTFGADIDALPPGCSLNPDVLAVAKDHVTQLTRQRQKLQEYLTDAENEKPLPPLRERVRALLTQMDESIKRYREIVQHDNSDMVDCPTPAALSRQASVTAASPSPARPLARTASSPARPPPVATLVTAATHAAHPAASSGVSPAPAFSGSASATSSALSAPTPMVAPHVPTPLPAAAPVPPLSAQELAGARPISRFEPRPFMLATPARLDTKAVEADDDDTGEESEAPAAMSAARAALLATAPVVDLGPEALCWGTPVAVINPNAAAHRFWVTDHDPDARPVALHDPSLTRHRFGSSKKASSAASGTMTTAAADGATAVALPAPLQPTLRRPASDPVQSDAPGSGQEGGSESGGGQSKKPRKLASVREDYNSTYARLERRLRYTEGGDVDSVLAAQRKAEFEGSWVSTYYG